MNRKAGARSTPASGPAGSAGAQGAGGPADRKQRRPPRGATRRRPAPDAEADDGAAQPAPGLDDARHVAGQRTAQAAQVLREQMFAALMADALGYNDPFDGPAAQAYLQHLLEDAGHPRDPIERMMVEQLAVAHFRIVQLHVRAQKAHGVEAAKLYNAAAARLLGEFRRTALGLRAYRGRLPEDRSDAKCKILKLAQ
jgi:hypothetical protein